MSDNSDYTVGIVAKPQSSGRLLLLDDLVKWLSMRNIAHVLDPEAALLAEKSSARILERPELPKQSDLIVVLGGDGTLLSIARHCTGLSVPILGVNLGSLGFLTETGADELFPALEHCLNDTATIQPRMMLKVTLKRKKETLATYNCLNDVVLNKGALARIIEIRVRVGEELLTGMRADGLIVSTPTGSTAYNLSAGGPILTPGMNGIIINPICPHTLTLRPLVVDVSLPIKVSLTQESGEVYLTADGQLGHPVGLGDRILIEKGSSSILLVTTHQRNYFTLLRGKLGWGVSIPEE